MKNEFENKIASSFAEAPDILQDIKKDARFKVPEKEHHSIFTFFLQNRFKFSFVSIFVIALLLVFGSNIQNNEQVYASTVTVDINPSIEITLDENDKVINVTALNDDGEILIDQDVNFKRMSIEEVVTIIVDRAVELGYIDPNEVENVVLIHVEGVSEDVRVRVQNKFHEKMDTSFKRYAPVVRILKSDEYDLTDEQIRTLIRTANEYNISPGKLVYVYNIELLDIDDEYSLQQLSRMSMRQLYRIEQQLKQKGNQD